MKKWQITKSGRCALRFGVGLFAVVAIGGVLSSKIVNAETVTSNASVNVTMSCTMSAAPGTGGIATTDGYSYSTTIDPGTHKEIDGSILTTSCSGTGNYSLYAIGYSGDSYDTPTNTQMIGSGTSAGTNIITGTATSGGTSDWAFKLINSGSYSPTIISPYNNYANIPGSDFVKVATYIPGTTGSVATSSVQAKYQVYVTGNQPVGTYTGKVKYTMVYPNDAPAPTPPPRPDNATCSTSLPGVTYMQELADSAKKASALSNMTQGSQYYLVDERDGQGYCVAKQADGNIWMTQNLDLDIGGTGVAALTSENTDLNASGSVPYVDGYSTSDGVITWTPDTTAYSSGRTISGTTVTGWTDDNKEPYSAEGGDRYYYTTGTEDAETVQTLAQCTAVSGRTEELCAHYHAGNYYNWTAAIASNASSGFSTDYAVAANSICPKGWKVPQGRTSSSADAANWQFGYLWYMSGVVTDISGSYTTNGFVNIRISPLFSNRAGYITGNAFNSAGGSGIWWTSSVTDSEHAYPAGFGKYGASPAYPTIVINSSRSVGNSVRCMVR